ncbi:T-cell receptor gamma alternate reading frame protein [Geothlypis trichas]
MLLLVVFVATASWSYGFAQEIPMQSPISITKFQKSARMTCEIQTEANFDDIVIHWYKQKEGEAPKRLLFVSEGKVAFESGFQANRYMTDISSVQKQCVLTIKDVIPDDAATYYCAYWDPHCDRNTKIIKHLKIDYTENLIFFKEYYIPMQTQLSCTDIVKALFTVIGYYNKVFGSGTKLIVSEKSSSPPKNSEILQKKHENQIMYVCFIEKFYPEVIRVTWTEDEKEVTDNVVKGDTWQSKEDEYSIASWLTVPAENEDKKYYCKYEHEEKSTSLPTQADSVKTASQEEDCGTVFNRDQLMHRTAYLVYIILLLKSSMYNIIILFFIYRMWALTKHRGKKA